MKNQKTNLFFYALQVMLAPQNAPSGTPEGYGETRELITPEEKVKEQKAVNEKIEDADKAMANIVLAKFAENDTELQQVYARIGYKKENIKADFAKKLNALTRTDEVENLYTDLHDEYKKIMDRIAEAYTITDVKLEDKSDGKHELVVKCQGVNGQPFEWFRKGIENPEGAKGFFKMKYATSNPEVGINMPERVNIDQQLPEKIFKNLAHGELDLMTNAVQKQLDQSRYQINLVGQADGLVGDYNYNLGLAKKRAEAAKKVLMKSYPWLDDKNFTITPKVVGVNGVEMKDGQKQENLKNLYNAWKAQNPDSKMTEKELITKLGDYDDNPSKLNESEKAFFDNSVGNYRGVEATVASRPQPKPETPPSPTEPVA